MFGVSIRCALTETGFVLYVRESGMGTRPVDTASPVAQDLLAMIEGPVLAVILLFPIGDAKGEDTRLGRLRLFNIGVVLQVANQIYAWVTPLAGTPPTNALEGPYYMKQTIQNACGTIAVLHAVLNNRDFVASGEEAARVGRDGML